MTCWQNVVANALYVTAKCNWKQECVCLFVSAPAGQRFVAVLMELLIMEEQGLIEKINIPWRCNEFHVEEQARYKLPVRHTHTNPFFSFFF